MFERLSDDCAMEAQLITGVYHLRGDQLPELYGLNHGWGLTQAHDKEDSEDINMKNTPVITVKTDGAGLVMRMLGFNVQVVPSNLSQPVANNHVS